MRRDKSPSSKHGSPITNLAGHRLTVIFKYCALPRSDCEGCGLSNTGPLVFTNAWFNKNQNVIRVFNSLRLTA